MLITKNELCPALKPGPLMVEEQKKFLQWLGQKRSCFVDDGFVEILSMEWEECSRRWIDVNKKIKELEIELEALRDRLVSLSSGSNCRGFGISVSSIKRKGNIDYSKIPELKNVDLEKYRKPETESWRVTCH